MYKMFIIKFCQLLLLTSTTFAPSIRPISFETADISVSIKSASGEWVAEAFNATSSISDPQMMQWVSLGMPRLLVYGEAENVTEGSQVNAFEFVAGGFNMYVETLSAEVARALAQRASVKYKSRIDASQFLSLNKHLGHFGCQFKLFDADKNSFENFTGSAVDLSNPVTVFFETANASKYEQILRRGDVSPLIQCTVESYRKECKQTLQMCGPRDQKPEPAFTERFSLSTKALRVKLQFEKSLQAAKKEFISSVLAAVDDRLRAANRSLSSLQTSGSKKFACAFALFDSTASSLFEANISSCADFAKIDPNRSATFTSNGRFIVPIGVSSVHVLVVGGGASGGSGHAGGGGSGYVQVKQVAVEQFERIAVTVGKGGQGSVYKVSSQEQTARGGEQSAFGHLTANGGVAGKSVALSRT